VEGVEVTGRRVVVVGESGDRRRGGEWRSRGRVEAPVGEGVEVAGPGRVEVVANLRRWMRCGGRSGERGMRRDSASEERGRGGRGGASVVWTSLGPQPRWVPGPTTRWAPGTTRLALHGT
jgi:hypothetical protein